jgi:hypothetical protein
MQKFAATADATCRPRKDKRSVDLISDALESFLIAGLQMIRP